MTAKKGVKCIICGKKRSKVLRIVHGVKIIECKKCRLAFSEKGKIVKKNIKKYAKNKHQHVKKFEEMLLILQDEIKKRDILEIEAGQNNFSRIKRKYKLVIFMDTLQHFKNPKSILTKARKILTQDGLIAILTPNYKSRLTNISKNGAKFYFSPYSLKLLLSHLGYEIRYGTTFDNYYDFRKTISGGIVKTLLFSSFYFLTRRLFWLSGRGGLVFVLAGKRYNKEKK